MSLLRDPWAVAAAAVVAVVVIACVGAPWWSPCGPAEQRLWLGAVAPGSAHPDVGAELDLRPGQRLLRVPSAAVAVAAELVEAPAVRYRLRVRRGAVEITRIAGAVAVVRLDLAAAPTRAEAEDGQRGRLLTGVVVAGAPPPPGLFAPGTSVAILRQEGAAERRQMEAALSGGVITAVREAGRPSPGRAVSGGAVEALRWQDAAGAWHDHMLVHPLGTDQLGRDVLARTLHGGRISLAVAAVATLVAVLIGTAVGAWAGYAGGRTDRLLMAGVDVLYGLPFLFLVILLLVTVRGDGPADGWRDLLLLFAALGAVQWLTMARIVRGTVLSLAGRDFCLAARATGLAPARIIRRHILPNCLGVVVVYATLTVPVVIMEESFLAFIGLGVSAAGVDAWGAQIDLGNQHIAWENGSRWWMLVAPAGAMVTTLAALSLLGDRLRTALDPRR
jgi:oligopeptide transport system permease protein